MGADNLKIKIEKPETGEMERQTDKNVELIVKQGQDDRDIGIIWTMSSTDGTYEAFKKVEARSWLTKAFSRVKEAKGNTLTSARVKVKKAICTGPYIKCGIDRLFKDRYPDLNKVYPEELRAIGIITIKFTIGGEAKIKEKYIFRAVVDTTTDEVIKRISLPKWNRCRSKMHQKNDHGRLGGNTKKTSLREKL